MLGGWSDSDDDHDSENKTEILFNCQTKINLEAKRLAPAIYHTTISLVTFATNDLLKLYVKMKTVA